MHVSWWRRTAVGLMLMCSTRVWPARASASSTQCRVATLEGEVRAGQSFARPIGNGLEVMLEPLPSGWILRVLPTDSARPQHDYAELATPPYRSVNPLLISTDYSFRAQDAAAWDPRRFRFVPNQKSFIRMLSAYNEYERRGSSSSAQETLAGLVSQATEGTLTILDTHLVPGVGDQVPAAAAVAGHFAATAHTLEKAADDRSTTLGKLISMRFRISLQLPRGFAADSHLKRRPCSQRS
jgi:hypothetical protein